jgi:hypothetical protein
MNFSEFLIRGPLAANGNYKFISNENAMTKNSQTCDKTMALWSDISKKSTFLFRSVSVLSVIGLGSLGVVVIANPISLSLVIGSVVAATACVTLTGFLYLRTIQAKEQSLSWLHIKLDRLLARDSRDFTKAYPTIIPEASKVVPEITPAPATPPASLNVEPVQMKSPTVPLQKPKPHTDSAQPTPYRAPRAPANIYRSRNERSVSSIQLKKRFRVEVLKIKDHLNEEQIALLMNLFDQSMRHHKPRFRFSALVNSYIPGKWDSSTACIIRDRLNRYVPE